MNIFQIIGKSIELTLENKWNLLINNLFFLMSMFISFGIFCSFFLLGLFGPFLFITDKTIYLIISLGLILIGLFVSLSLFFASRVVYFYFITQTLSLRKRFNLIEELEILDKYFIKYSLLGWLENIVPLATAFFVFIFFIFIKEELLKIVFIIFSLLATFALCPYTFFILPNAIPSNKNLIAVISESIKITNKCYLQSLIVSIIIFILKLAGVVLLVAYPFYLTLFFYPLFNYTQILLYKAAAK
ncbi:MAG: hypothetical protein QXV44_01535 [Candidatus Anstonellaceae archaeon]